MTPDSTATPPPPPTMTIEAPAEPTDAPDAATLPFVAEFDLDEPRSGPPRGPVEGTNFTPSCDAGACTCRIDAECPAEQPKCDFFGYCAQCLSNDDCLRVSTEAAVCERGSCRGCYSDGECPPGWDCQMGSCVDFCDDDRDCQMGWNCDDGVCARDDSD
jgi:hypothetical protein